jgi:signal transduction histidine kinase
LRYDSRVIRRAHEQLKKAGSESLSRQALAMVLFALVGMLFLASEFAFARPLPSVLWLALLGLGLAGWAATAPAETNAVGAPPASDSQSINDQVGAFALLAHELYTPINAVKGFAELLRDAERNGHSAAHRLDYADQVLASARQLQALVGDMMDAGRLAAGNLALVTQDCDVAEVLEIALRGVEDEATARGVSLVAQVAPGILTVADGPRLLRAMSGLIGNAIAFSPSGSVVNLRMLKADDGGLVVSVTDTGFGMSKAELSRVFAPYGVSNEGDARSPAGLGLGLYVAREVARLHGGDLVLVSQVGVGTEARFILPPQRVIWPVSKPPALARVA